MGDYFWDVWREPNDQCGAASNEDRAVFFSSRFRAYAASVTTAERS